MAAIRAAQPPRLYVAADGPGERFSDAERCAKAWHIATAVDWPCQLYTLSRDQNLGCRKAVSTAIDWFFENEEEGIILEDDCLPSADFFPFCGELLSRFRSENRVMAICGSCYTKSTVNAPESYYFAYFPDIWGWATWRRAWQLYDRNLSRWSKLKQSGRLTSMFDGKSWRESMWSSSFDRTVAGEIDTWDYQWIYTVIEQGGLACYPKRNLVSNLGWGLEATHTKIQVGMQPAPLACKPHEPYSFPLRHPRRLARSKQLERELESARFYYWTKELPEPASFKRLIRSRLTRIIPLVPRGVLEGITAFRGRIGPRKFFS
jgi:hypothetical protein